MIGLEEDVERAVAEPGEVRIPVGPGVGELIRRLELQTEHGCAWDADNDEEEPVLVGERVVKEVEQGEGGHECTVGAHSVL